MSARVVEDSREDLGGRLVVDRLRYIVLEYDPPTIVLPEQLAPFFVTGTVSPPPPQVVF